MYRYLKPVLIAFATSTSPTFANEPLQVEYQPLPGNLLLVDADSHTRIGDEHAASYRAIDIDDIYSDAGKLFYTEYLRYRSAEISFGFRTRKSYDCATQKSEYSDPEPFSLSEPKFINLDEEPLLMLYAVASGEESNLRELTSATCKAWARENQIANRAMFVDFLRGSHANISYYLLNTYAKDDSGFAKLIDLFGINTLLVEQEGKLKQTQFFVDYQLKSCGENPECWDSKEQVALLMVYAECQNSESIAPPELARCPRKQ